MLLHAAGDQHAWAAVVGSGSPPGYDPFFPIGNSEALAAEIPDARLARLGRTGHRLPARAIPIVAQELIAHTAADRATAEPRQVRTLIDRVVSQAPDGWPRLDLMHGR